MIRIRAGVDDEADRLVRELVDLGQQRLAQLRRACIHQQHAVVSRILTNLDSDVAERAGKHINVALHVADFVLLGGSGDHAKTAESGDFHLPCSCSNCTSNTLARGMVICLSFFRYSGYMVSAPPRLASNGTPYSVENSRITLFVPGK